MGLFVSQVTSFSHAASFLTTSMLLKLTKRQCFTSFISHKWRTFVWKMVVGHLFYRKICNTRSTLEYHSKAYYSTAVNTNNFSGSKLLINSFDRGTLTRKNMLSWTVKNTCKKDLSKKTWLCVGASLGPGLEKIEKRKNWSDHSQCYALFVICYETCVKIMTMHCMTKFCINSHCPIWKVLFLRCPCFENMIAWGPMQCSANSLTQ